MTKTRDRRKYFRESGPSLLTDPSYTVFIGGNNDESNHTIYSQNFGATADFNFIDDAMPAPYVDQDDGRTFHWVGLSPTVSPGGGNRNEHTFWSMGDGRNSSASPRMTVFWRSISTDSTGSGITTLSWSIVVEWEPYNAAPGYHYFQNTASIDFNTRTNEWFHFFLTGDDTSGFEMSVIGEDGVLHKLNQYLPVNATEFNGQWFAGLDFAANEPSGLVNGLGQLFLWASKYKNALTAQGIFITKLAQATHWHYKLNSAEMEELFDANGLIDPLTVSFYTSGRLRNYWEFDDNRGDTADTISDQTGHSPCNGASSNASLYTRYHLYPQPNSWGQTKSFALTQAGSKSINFGNVLDVDGSETRTYSGWFYWPAVTATNHFFFYKYDGSGVGVRHYIDTIEQLNFSYRDAVSGTVLAVRGTVKPTVAAWNHVCMTYDGSSTAAGVNMYLNGVRIGKTVLTDTLVTSISNTADFQVLGGDYNIFDLCIWSKEFTYQEQLELYNDGIQFDPLTHSAAANLIWNISPGNVPGDDSTGTTGIIQDRSTSGFDGTPFNTLAGDIVTSAPD